MRRSNECSPKNLCKLNQLTNDVSQLVATEDKSPNDLMIKIQYYSSRLIKFKNMCREREVDVPILHNMIVLTIEGKNYDFYPLTLDYKKAYAKETHSAESYSDCLVGYSECDSASVSPKLFSCRVCKSMIYAGFCERVAGFVGRCGCADYRIDTIFKAFNDEYKTVVVFVPPSKQREVSSWSSVFPSDNTISDKTITHPKVFIGKKKYTFYFVTFTPKMVIEPGKIEAAKFKKQQNFVLEKDGKQRAFACYFCKAILKTNDNERCQCFCGTYPADGGYQYHLDYKRVTESVEYTGRVPEYRVILVGASGKGKSTLINGLSSYSKHDTLKNAIDNKLIPIIPINFRVLKKFKQYPVHIKTDTPDDDNEDFSGGGVRSTTQKPKRHLFNLPGTMPDKLTFIDTPGINDTRGHKMDDQNIEYIKRALIEAQYVHAVCFVLSANDIKMITSYETVLRRLLSLVPKDALKNVVFFFNSTRGTNYGIGDSIEPLTCVFSSLQQHGYNVHFADENVFFFENDCFRYLCAAHIGIPYNENISAPEFEESWEVNRSSYWRLVEYLKTRDPVNGASFDRLDKAREWLTSFAQVYQTLNKTKHHDQIYAILHAFDQKDIMTVDEQLVLFNKLAWLLREHITLDLCESIQRHVQFRRNSAAYK